MIPILYEKKASASEGKEPKGVMDLSKNRFFIGVRDQIQCLYSSVKRIKLFHIKFKKCTHKTYSDSSSEGNLAS